MDKSKKESRNFACQMEAAIFEKMDAYCKEHRMSKTGFVELAILEYLAKRQVGEGKSHE